MWDYKGKPWEISKTDAHKSVKSIPGIEILFSQDETAVFGGDFQIEAVFNLLDWKNADSGTVMEFLLEELQNQRFRYFEEDQWHSLDNSGKIYYLEHQNAKGIEHNVDHIIIATTFATALLDGHITPTLYRLTHAAIQREKEEINIQNWAERARHQRRQSLDDMEDLLTRLPIESEDSVR